MPLLVPLHQGRGASRIASEVRESGSASIYVPEFLSHFSISHSLAKTRSFVTCAIVTTSLPTQDFCGNVLPFSASDTQARRRIEVMDERRS